MARCCRSRSFKIIETSTNRQPVCDFLSVVNSNLGYNLLPFTRYCDETPEIAVLSSQVKFQGLDRTAVLHSVMKTETLGCRPSKLHAW